MPDKRLWFLNKYLTRLGRYGFYTFFKKYLQKKQHPHLNTKYLQFFVNVFVVRKGLVFILSIE